MTFDIVDEPSPNAEPRPDGIAIDMAVLHYTGMRTRDDALRRMLDPAAKVSAHWMIDEDGTRYRLVPEERRAWHAGVARWRGEANINDRSVGIELVNPGHDWGYRPFPAAQMASLEGLLMDLVARFAIPPERILGHADVAPLRKADPGELFDWEGIAAIGLGVWSEASAPPAGVDPGDAGQIQGLLRRFGYDAPRSARFDADTAAVLTAFQRHFRPGGVSGAADPETVARLADLAARYG